MTIESEQILIGQIKAGDRNAYALLVNEYASAVFNLAYRMTASNEDADDLTQEAFMRAYESLGSFEESRRFFPWIYTIALNGIRNHLKRNKGRGTATLEDLSKQPPMLTRAGPEQTVMAKQERENVTRLLQRLPLNLREAIVLRYYQDLPFDEIAAILDMSPGAAKMRVHRGLEKLKLLITRDQ